MTAYAFTDGGNRETIACAASVILSSNGEVHEESRLFYGDWTNNHVEYHGVILALKAAHSIGERSLKIFSDSLLVVNQLNDIYSVKKVKLKVLFAEAIRLASLLDEVSISHVPRKQNLYADALCNYEMDVATGRKTLIRSTKRLSVARRYPPSGYPFAELEGYSILRSGT